MKKNFYFFCLMCLLAGSQLNAQEKAYVLKPFLWHTRTISVCWDNPTTDNQPMREVVKQAITDTWQKYSALQFTDWCPSTQKDADIHIYINDEGPHTKGLGTKIKNMVQGMVLNFSFNNWSQACITEKVFCIKAIAVHEFGHALGFAHEQNRQDCHFPDCLGMEQGTNGNWTISPCDLNSVMNYCNPQYNNNGILSTSDIEAVQKLYGLPSNRNMEYAGLQTVQNSAYMGNGNNGQRLYDFRVFISGTKEGLDSIDKVVYDLKDAGHTFRRSKMKGKYRESNFGIGLLKVWGEFDIKVTILFKEGTKKELVHHLRME